MGKFAISVFINRSQQEVFDFLSNPANLSTNLYNYKMNTRAFPIERLESTITLAPKNNCTQVTFENQFEIVGVLKFAEGFFAKMGEKQDGRNFDIAKQILEAG